MNPLVIDPGAFILVPVRISHRSITMFDPQLPFSRVHPAVLVRLDSIAMRQVLLPLTLVEVSIRPSIDTNTVRFVIIVVAKVDTLICVHVPPEPIFLVALPEALVLGPC